MASKLYVSFLSLFSPSLDMVVSTEDKKVAVTEEAPSGDINIVGHTLFASCWTRSRS